MKKYFFSVFAFLFFIFFMNKKLIAQNNFRADSTLEIMKK